MKREALKTLLYALAFVAILAGISKITTSKTRTEQTEAQTIKPEKQTEAQTIKPKVRYREYVIIDPDYPSSPVREYPSFNSRIIGRLKGGRKMMIFGREKIKHGEFYTTFYMVAIKGKMGWISEHVTTREIIREKIQNNNDAAES